MADNYEVGRFLGKGSFATVHLARNIHTKQSFAIKIIDVTSCQQQQNDIHHVVEDEPYTIAALLQREIDVHMSVSSSRHPNIVSLIESFRYNNEITGNEMKALILDYCELGDLQSYMKRVRDERKRQQYDEGTRGTLLLPEGTFLSVNQIRHTVSQVLCGLSFLHARGILHRDIKAPNIFLCPIQTSSVDNTTLNKKGKQNIQFSLLDCRIKLGDFGLAVQMEVSILL